MFLEWLRGTVVILAADFPSVRESDALEVCSVTTSLAAAAPERKKGGGDDKSQIQTCSSTRCVLGDVPVFDGLLGVKFLNTQIVSSMLGLEIWDTKAGRKVFSATSDLTIANERIREKPKREI